jgi:hypothetical protein
MYHYRTLIGVFSCIVLIIFGESHLPDDHPSPSLRKDGHLHDLIDLMNNNSDRFALFSKYKSEASFYGIIEALTPWITASPSHDLIVKQRPYILDYNTTNCGNKRYEKVLSGKPLDRNQSIYLIDLVPFGFDVDLLEIRLYETYDIIDAFIIYESPKTQSAHKKPLYYQLIKDQERFQRFQDKILYLSSDDQDLRSLVTRTIHGPTSGPGYLRDRFALERSMRSEPIRLFKEMKNESHPLKQQIMNNIHHAWILQNDGDEIPTGEALLHFKYCERRYENIEEYFFPSFPFKKNFNWIQTTKDLGCMNGGNINTQTEALRFHTWRPGPYIQPLERVLRDGETYRYRKSDSIIPCEHHMGLGAATHLSSTAEPAEYLLKRYSVIEQNHHGSFTEKLVDAGKTGKLTPDLLVKETLMPWCDTKHISQLPNNVALELVWESMPWVVRYNPWRYPFVLPGALLKLMIMDVELMIQSRIISDQLISLHNETVYRHSKHVQTAYGMVVIPSTVGVIEHTAYLEWICKANDQMYRR